MLSHGAVTEEKKPIMHMHLALSRTSELTSALQQLYLGLARINVVQMQVPLRLNICPVLAFLPPRKSKQRIFVTSILSCQNGWPLLLTWFWT